MAGTGILRQRDADAGPVEPVAELAPRDLIITLFGLYARAANNWLSVASLIRMMGDLGVDGPAVRSSVSRLKRRDILSSEPHGGVVGYALSPRLLGVLAEGDSRIFAGRRATAEDGWVLAVFSVPEAEREKRHLLRSALARLGFGTAAPGVWIAPGSIAEAARDSLARRGLADYVELFTAAQLAFGDAQVKVREWWDLDELGDLYASFVRQYRPFHQALLQRAPRPQAAFTLYVPLLTRWRQLPYRDPGLPLAVLPPGWIGMTAERLFADLNAALAGPAREYALTLSG